MCPTSMLKRGPLNYVTLLKEWAKKYLYPFLPWIILCVYVQIILLNSPNTLMVNLFHKTNLRFDGRIRLNAQYLLYFRSAISELEIFVLLLTMESLNCTFTVYPTTFGQQLPQFNFPNSYIIPLRKYPAVKMVQ